jgi:hypothetical protein
MTNMLGLQPEDEKRLHPGALKWFNARRADIQFEVPLEELDDDDLNAFLSDDEKRGFAGDMDEITRGLAAFIDMDTTSDDPVRKVVTGLSLVAFETDSLLPMHRIKLLLEKVYQRKVAKAEKEQREQDEEDKRNREQAEAERKKKEDSEKWVAAYLAIGPPDDDANRYLDDQEYQKFKRATWKAVDVYKAKGKDYLNDIKASDYRYWLWRISRRKEEEQIRLNAQAQAQSFRARLDQGLRGMTEILSPSKEGPAAIFKRHCADEGENRYLEEQFTDILTSDDESNREWTQGYIRAAEEELQKSIPGELRDFILTKPRAAFFLLPSANYSYHGVPCLDFYFDVYAVITITVLARAGHKLFNGHRHGFLTDLREPRLLGFYQIIINPNEPHFWQSVPLTILCALIDGNLQPAGTTVLERTDRLTVYEVKKFAEDTCEIPISFERYCRGLGSVEKMKEIQIIGERTAEILESLRPIGINHKESKGKKTEAFDLFGKGKRPSDPEVRGLGVKPERTYRYYQEWKKLAPVA